ncbi:universal stress protein [Prosthecobacter sp.]|uniref:universal stress protein n=1 Tax=Prosthecobacter sp. TaxID=1965333 RepID=UPI002AB85E6F|nr:universal stress protein [Prosthecobacter sp.]MDZ4403628.1 universal stress protein [Prosthecobacter sp.]
MQILCATDFSKAAMAAADIAAALAKKLQLPLRLVHCAQDYIVMGDLPVVVPDDQPLREQLKREAQRLRATGLEVVEEFRHGNASPEIIDAAAEQPTKMIILGSVGKGMAERWLLGSVAERVAEGASVPTLIVRQPDLLRDWLGGEAALRLLCGVDFTASADAAIAAVQTLVTLGQVEVEAAYVRLVEDHIISKEQQDARQRDVWERLHAILGDVPVKVHVSDVVGLPAAEFLRTADEQKSGLLVVGTHQRHGWQRLKAPSFSRSTLAHATANVLCVPSAAGLPETCIPSIHRVLLATNFTDVCTEALRHAHGLLPAGGAIHLVHVCHEPSSGINPVIASEVYFDHSIATTKARGEAEVKLKALPASLLSVPGVAITSEVLTHHDIAAAICEAAERRGADVICMGTQGHSRTGVALLGSTVQAVLAVSHKPVFVVTPPLS